MEKRVLDHNDGTVSVTFYSESGRVFGYVYFNKITKNGKVVDYELTNENSFLEAAKNMNKSTEEVYRMAIEEIDRGRLNVGDKIEFSYLDSIRIGRVVDIVTYFSAEKNEIIDTIIFLKDDDGDITPYALNEMEEIDVLKKMYDSNGREIELGDFAQYSPADYKNYVWGEIIPGADTDYAIEVLYPRSKEGKIYSIDGQGVVILSKYRD